jgi:formamidopyrimidine-DNA glycosylase
VRVEAAPAGSALSVSAELPTRLEGQTVSGSAGAPKYLLADLSSGEVLLMHLGMSGSFHVLHGSDESGPGKFHSRARQALGARSRGVPHVERRVVTFNDPRRFGYMKLIARDELNQHPMIEALGPEPLGNASTARCWREPARERRLAQGRAVGPEGRGGSRQHLCVRGAASRASLAQAPGLDHRDAKAARRAGARMRSPTPSRRC